MRYWTTTVTVLLC